MLVYGCVSSHVSKPSSPPRISHGAQAREAKVLSRSQPLRSTNSDDHLYSSNIRQIWPLPTCSFSPNHALVYY